MVYERKVLVFKSEYEEYKRLKKIIPLVIDILAKMNICCDSGIEIYTKKMECINLLLNRKVVKND